MEKLNFDNLQIDRSLPTLSISACLGLLSKPFDADKAAEDLVNGDDESDADDDNESK